MKIYASKNNIIYSNTTIEGRKEMFYLTTHSTHFILWLYGVGYMVKDHSDSERGNLLPPHGLLFSINSKGSFICTIQDRITQSTAFVTPVVENWLEQEIAQWVHPMKDRSDDPSHHERTVLPRSYISLPPLSKVQTSHMMVYPSGSFLMLYYSSILTMACHIKTY